MNRTPRTTIPILWCPWPGRWPKARWSGARDLRQRRGRRVAANKVPGVRAALITDPYSAHQGVEDDDMNIMCLGGRVTCYALAWDLVQTFLKARFKGADRFRRRLEKMTALEKQEKSA